MDATSDRSLLINMNYMQQLSSNIEMLQIREMELRAQMDIHEQIKFDKERRYYDHNLE
jgi:hypothetical protein